MSLLRISGCLGERPEVSWGPEVRGLPNWDYESSSRERICVTCYSLG
jgi:hypothetical protein